MKVLSFDIWGRYAHFKKIYATTTAVTYPIPTKTALYGYVGAILGMEKRGNAYLKHFPEGSCRIALQICKPLVLQRVNTNLRPSPARFVANRKPTMMEYVYEPFYRVYFWHKENSLYQQLKEHLEKHEAVFTPTLGLSNLISNFAYKGELETEQKSPSHAVDIHSVIPKTDFKAFDREGFIEGQNEIVELNMYALEMDMERNVTKRGDILLDRNGKPIMASVDTYEAVTATGENIMFF